MKDWKEGTPNRPQEMQEQCSACEFKKIVERIHNSPSNMLLFVTVEPKEKSCIGCLFGNRQFGKGPCNECVIWSNWRTKTDLINTKIWIGDNPRLSELIQKKFFALGYRWYGEPDAKLLYTNNSILFIEEDSTITRSSSSRANFDEDNSSFIAITPQDIGIDPKEYEVRLVTEDGKNLYYNDRAYVYSPDDKYNTEYSVIMIDRFKAVEGAKYFSTGETRRKYIEEVNRLVEKNTEEEANKLGWFLKQPVWERSTEKPLGHIVRFDRNQQGVYAVCSDMSIGRIGYPFNELWKRDEATIIANQKGFKIGDMCWGIGAYKEQGFLGSIKTFELWGSEKNFVGARLVYNRPLYALDCFTNKVAVDCKTKEDMELVRTLVNNTGPFLPSFNAIAINEDNSFHSTSYSDVDRWKLITVDEYLEAIGKKRQLKANTGKFKVGDRVRVVRKGKTGEGDWLNGWIESMDNLVGKIVTIEASRENYGYIVTPIWNVPEFVLEKVEPICYTNSVYSKPVDDYGCELCKHSVNNSQCQLRVDWSEGGKTGKYPCIDGDRFESIPKQEAIYEGDKVWIWDKYLELPVQINMGSSIRKNTFYFLTEEEANKFIYDKQVEELKTKYKQNG